jgi:RNA polymerase sigma-70 factor, ECF subfamily
VRESGREAERFEELFRSTRDDLLRYLLRRTRSPEEAADLLAETYAIAWRRLAALPLGEQAPLWLLGVARNLLRKSQSRGRSQSAVVARLALELQAASNAVAESAESEVVGAALQRLPQSQREAVMLTAWEGLTPREIAAVTGTPVNLVRVRLHRARARLRSDLGHLDPEGDPSAPATKREPCRPTRHDMANACH